MLHSHLPVHLRSGLMGRMVHWRPVGPCGRLTRRRCLVVTVNGRCRAITVYRRLPLDVHVSLVMHHCVSLVMHHCVGLVRGRPVRRGEAIRRRCRLMARGADRGADA